MDDRRRRLSIPLIVWPARGRNRDSAQSNSCQKSRNSAPLLDTQSVNDSPSQPRRSLPAMATQTEQIVQRIMTEPLRPPPSAVVAAHRSIGQPMTSTSRPSSAGAIAASTPAQNVTRGRFSMNLSTRRRDSQQKRDIAKRKHFEIVVTLLLFCITAVISDIVLAFTLPNFPNFSHVFFIGILFVEFAFVIRALLSHARNVRRKIAESTREGPPPGAVIQGAPNWDGLPDGPHGGFDLESIGAAEALKPTPPAYGMYRGSVRIVDSDIRLVRRDDSTQPQLQLAEEGPLGARLPPSYEAGRTRI